ncbi:MAG: winged helix-turn-helix transcriptional regulator [Methanobacteriota archaeon]|nr:MAG: winged helix-turn-helix transcriptional regulator [Euryarchaeota archaeon]
MRAASLAVLIVLASAAACLLAVHPARGAELEAGGTPRVQLVVHVDSPGDVVRSGDPLPLRVRVVDQNYRPIAGATVTVRATGATVTPASVATDESGFARFTLTAHVTEAIQFTITASAVFPDAIPGDASLSVIAIPPPAPAPVLGRPEALSAGIGIAAILAALASTEIGKYGLANLVLFPLYSRLKKEEVLDHFVRGQIYGYIMSHPGDHYNSVRDALKVTNGTLAHHLRTLEIQGFIKADRDGIYKRFYPVEMQIPRDKGIRLSDLQHNMLGLIRSDGGPTQQEIADRLAVSQQTVSYNLRHLAREGLVRMEKDGRARRYFSADA